MMVLNYALNLEPVVMKMASLAFHIFRVIKIMTADINVCPVIYGLKKKVERLKHQWKHI